MNHLNKIFHRHTNHKVTPIIEVYTNNDTVLCVYRQKIEQVVLQYFDGPETQDKVVREVKKATGLLIGNVTLKYYKRKNLLKVFYCCAPF